MFYHKRRKILKIQTGYNWYDDKRLVLNCRVLIFDIARPGKSFKSFPPCYFEFGKTFPLACSTQISSIPILVLWTYYLLRWTNSIRNFYFLGFTVHQLTVEEQTVSGNKAIATPMNEHTSAT